MNVKGIASVERRAAVHAALAEPARLRIVDALTLGDASPGELQGMLDAPSNLVAHHLRVLQDAGIVARSRSEADRRRSYVRLLPQGLAGMGLVPVADAARVVFVCTANSARSQIAATLWRRTSTVPVASAGTHPAAEIDPGARDVARRHDTPLPETWPRPLEDVLQAGDLVITVCDNAHEELSHRHHQHALHWSVPDPVPIGTDAAYDEAYEALSHRISTLAPRLRAC